MCRTMCRTVWYCVHCTVAPLSVYMVASPLSMYMVHLPYPCTWYISLIRVHGYISFTRVHGASPSPRAVFFRGIFFVIFFVTLLNYARGAVPV